MRCSFSTLSDSGGTVGPCSFYSFKHKTMFSLDYCVCPQPFYLILDPPVLNIMDKYLWSNDGVDCDWCIGLWRRFGFYGNQYGLLLVWIAVHREPPKSCLFFSKKQEMFILHFSLHPSSPTFLLLLQIFKGSQCTEPSLYLSLPSLTPTPEIDEFETVIFVTNMLLTKVFPKSLWEWNEFGIIPLNWYSASRLEIMQRLWWIFFFLNLGRTVYR